MRSFALIFAVVLALASLNAGVASADGIERPHPVRHHRPRPHRHVELQGAPAPAPVVEPGPEVVTLQPAFFSSGGGVGADIGTAAIYTSTVIIRGGSATSSAFAFASARASAGVGGHSGGGGHGGGCSCR